MRSFMNYLRQELLPTTWCPGCGNGIVLKTVCDVLDELNIPKNEVIVVSGIGCSGRSAGYFDLDTVHTAHGRAIPVAEGIKAANEKLKVVVMSGDGDLLGIGGNHLLHATRRNADITVICFDNEIYGMTGGQVSPTTRLGIKTLTTPRGCNDIPVNVQAIVRGHDCFYARTTAFHIKHMKKCIMAAFKHRGFSFVEARIQCIVNNGRRLGFNNAHEMLMSYKENYKINDNTPQLNDNEIGITTEPMKTNS